MSQLRYKNIVGDDIKSLANVEVNYIHQSIKQAILSQKVIRLVINVAFLVLLC